MKGKGCTSPHLSLTSGNRPFFLHRSETSPNLTALLYQDTAVRTSVSVLDFYIFFSFCLLGNMSHFELITNTRQKSKGNFFVFQKCIQNFTTYTSGSCKHHVGNTFTMAGGQDWVSWSLLSRFCQGTSSTYAYPNSRKVSLTASHTALQREHRVGLLQHLYIYHSKQEG